MLFYGRLSHLQEDTEALDGEKSGSSTQEDPKVRECTGVGYLASCEQKKDENTGSWAPRLGPVGPPLQAHGIEAGSRVPPDGVN